MNLSNSIFRVLCLPSLIVLATMCLLMEQAQAQIDANKVKELTKNLPKDPKARLESVPVGTLHVSHKLPTNFPLPIYASNVLSKSFTNTTQGTPQAQVILMTKDDPTTVLSWYKSQCAGAGWSISLPKAQFLSAREKNGSMFTLHAEKGDQQATISAAQTKKANMTTVSIVWQKHKL